MSVSPTAGGAQAAGAVPTTARMWTAAWMVTAVFMLSNSPTPLYGVAASAHLGQPLLRQRAGLFDGQFPVLAQGGLAAFPGVRALLEHEHLAACRGNLAQEAGHQRIPEFDGLRVGLCRIDCGLGELDLRRDDSLERLDSQEPHRGLQRGSRVRFRKAPADGELA